MNKLNKEENKHKYFNEYSKNILNKYINKNIYYKIIKNIMKKELYILYIKQNILLNNLKYKDNYITPLSKILKIIFNKKIIFNIVCLKNYFLNSDIFTQIIANKAKERKNRITKLFRVSILKANIPTIKKRLIKREKKLLNKKKYLILSKNIIKSKFDEYNTIINDNNFNIPDNRKTGEILKHIDNKIISGIRIEAAGRLTKRFTAQRSVYKLKYKGTIKNIDSSYKGLPSKLLRNQLKSNMQYTYSSSSNRIGAFGIKG